MDSFQISKTMQDGPTMDDPRPRKEYGGLDMNANEGSSGGGDVDVDDAKRTNELILRREEKYCSVRQSLQRSIDEEGRAGVNDGGQTAGIARGDKRKKT